MEANEDENAIGIISSLPSELVFTEIGQHITGIPWMLHNELPGDMLTRAYVENRLRSVTGWITLTQLSKRSRAYLENSVFSAAPSFADRMEYYLRYGMTQQFLEMQLPPEVVANCLTADGTFDYENVGRMPFAQCRGFFDSYRKHAEVLLFAAGLNGSEAIRQLLDRIVPLDMRDVRPRLSAYYALGLYEGDHEHWVSVRPAFIEPLIHAIIERDDGPALVRLLRVFIDNEDRFIGDVMPIILAEKSTFGPKCTRVLLAEQFDTPDRELPFATDLLTMLNERTADCFTERTDEFAAALMKEDNMEELALFLRPAFDAPLGPRSADFIAECLVLVTELLGPANIGAAAKLCDMVKIWARCSFREDLVPRVLPEQHFTRELRDLMGAKHDTEALMAYFGNDAFSRGSMVRPGASSSSLPTVTLSFAAATDMVRSGTGIPFGLYNVRANFSPAEWEQLLDKGFFTLCPHPRTWLAAMPMNDRDFDAVALRYVKSLLARRKGDLERGPALSIFDRMPDPGQPATAHTGPTILAEYVEFVWYYLFMRCRKPDDFIAAIRTLYVNTNYRDDAKSLAEAVFAVLALFVDSAEDDSEPPLPRLADLTCLCIETFFPEINLVFHGYAIQMTIQKLAEFAAFKGVARVLRLLSAYELKSNPNRNKKGQARR